MLLIKVILISLQKYSLFDFDRSMKNLGVYNFEAVGIFVIKPILI